MTSDSKKSTPYIFCSLNALNDTDAALNCLSLSFIMNFIYISNIYRHIFLSHDQFLNLRNVKERTYKSSVILNTIASFPIITKVFLYMGVKSSGCMTLSCLKWIKFLISKEKNFRAAFRAAFRAVVFSFLSSDTKIRQVLRLLCTYF